MTDETFNRILAYAKWNAAAKVVVDEDLEIDDPVLPQLPLPAEVRVCPSDFEDLQRRCMEYSLERDFGDVLSEQANAIAQEEEDPC